MKELLITSSILIIVLLILRAVFATKVRRTLIYGTWLLVALRLLLPFQIGELSISVLNLFQPVTQTITDISDKQVAGITEQDAHQQVMQEYIEQDQTVFVPEVQEQIQSALDSEMPKEEIADMIDRDYPEIYVPEVRPQVQEKVEKNANPITLGQILWSVWGIGAVAVAIWLAVSNLRFVRGIKKAATAISVDSPIPVFVTEKAVSPCLVGLFRPAVYLTPEVASNDQLRHYVMTHELTHYAHRDHIWSMVRCLCLCLHWFSPLVWIAAWCSRRDCELACDEGAMARLGEEQRIDYGKALLAVVQEASMPSRLMLTATAMAETKQQLQQRVRFIARKPHLSLLAAIALVLVCALVVGCVATGAKPQTAAEDPNMEVPAITEPTESTTPAETTAPTQTLAPTNATIPITVPTVTIPITIPTTTPTTVPTTEPTTLPTAESATEPTTVPTTVPTSAPTTEPTTVPTTVPTTAPTAIPTTAPVYMPTTAPTRAPATTAPTTAPTFPLNPSWVTNPFYTPTVPTTAPTTVPTTAPTTAPTTVPTTVPTTAPTTVPTTAPTVAPTTAPTASTAGALVATKASDLMSVKTVAEFRRRVFNSDPEYIPTFHYIQCPALAADTPVAQAINNEIYNDYSRAEQALRNYQKGDDLYHFGYHYTHYEGIIGIIIDLSISTQSGETFPNYKMYYYNANTGQQLTFEEYMEALGVNKEYYDFFVEKRTNYKNFEVKGAITQHGTVLYPNSAIGQTYGYHYVVIHVKDKNLNMDVLVKPY